MTWGSLQGKSVVARVRGGFIMRWCYYMIMRAYCQSHKSKTSSSSFHLFGGGGRRGCREGSTNGATGGSAVRLLAPVTRAVPWGVPCPSYSQYTSPVRATWPTRLPELSLIQITSSACAGVQEEKGAAKAARRRVRCRVITVSKSLYRY